MTRRVTSGKREWLSDMQSTAEQDFVSVRLLSPAAAQLDEPPLQGTHHPNAQVSSRFVRHDGLLCTVFESTGQGGSRPREQAAGAARPVYGRSMNRRMEYRGVF